MNSVIRLLLADDHAVVRSGMRKVLEADPRCEVIAEASDGKEAIVISPRDEAGYRGGRLLTATHQRR